LVGQAPETRDAQVVEPEPELPRRLVEHRRADAGAGAGPVDAERDAVADVQRVAQPPFEPVSRLDRHEHLVATGRGPPLVQDWTVEGSVGAAAWNAPRAATRPSATQTESAATPPMRCRSRARASMRTWLTVPSRHPRGPPGTVAARRGSSSLPPRNGWR